MTVTESNNAPIDESNPVEESFENDPNGESVTPDEVADLLNLPQGGEEDKSDESDEEDADDADADEEQKDDENEDENADDADADELDDDSDDDPADDAADDEGEDGAPTLDDEDDSEFSLEVEDANGVKFTLRPGDDIEKELAEFEPKSNGQIMKVLNDFNKLEAAKTEHDQKQEAEAAKADEKARVAKIQEGWEKEIKALQGEKRIPVDATGKADQKRVKEVMDFMNKENAKRSEADRPLLTSFEDALDKLELREHKSAEADKAKKEKEDARKKGGMVGGSSAPASGSGPKYTPGARSAEEAARGMGLL